MHLSPIRSVTNQPEGSVLQMQSAKIVGAVIATNRAHTWSDRDKSYATFQILGAGACLDGCCLSHVHGSILFTKHIINHRADTAFPGAVSLAATGATDPRTHSKSRPCNRIFRTRYLAVSRLSRRLHGRKGLAMGSFCGGGDGVVRSQRRVSSVLRVCKDAVFLGRRHRCCSGNSCPRGGYPKALSASKMI
jgi:hypothetical protein